MTVTRKRKLKAVRRSRLARKHGRVLDRIPFYDPNNEQYRVRTMDCFASGKERKRVRRKKKVHLDQGEEGACTGFGTGHVLACTPLPHPDITNETGFTLYRRAQFLDEIPGEGYSGSTINGVMAAALEAGKIDVYRWCKTLAEVRHALSYHGALVIGVNWYEGMFNTDAEGFIRVTGAIAGGHAIALVGYKTLADGTRVYRLENSWGPTWGDNGGCWITEADLQRLLDEDGDFACPRKVAA